MKKFLGLTLLLLGIINASAKVFVTPGTGTAYTLESLAETEGTGVVANGAGVKSYYINDSITIAAGDSLIVDGAYDLLLGNAVVINIEGYANFRGSTSAPLMVVSQTDATPYGIWINTDENTSINFSGCYFHGPGIRVNSAKEVIVDNCNFEEHNGNEAAAVFLSFTGPKLSVSSSAFTRCEKAGVGSAANANSSISIDQCTFLYNGTRNGNTPQINVTAGPEISITNNTVLGDTTLTKVGGIAVGNLMMKVDAFKATISGNDVENNRYGINITGPTSADILNNKIINNNTETNAMNGGAGISAYYSGTSNELNIGGNEITGNLWGVTILGNSYYGGNNVNMGKLVDGTLTYGGNTLSNNGNGGVLYDLYNNSTDTIYAQGNTWGVEVQDSASIETVITHQPDDASLGVVVYWPGATALAIRQPNAADMDETPQYYDLSGRRLPALPRRGITIERRGSKSRTIVL